MQHAKPGGFSSFAHDIRYTQPLFGLYVDRPCFCHADPMVCFVCGMQVAEIPLLPIPVTTEKRPDPRLALTIGVAGWIAQPQDFGKTQAAVAVQAAVATASATGLATAATGVLAAVLAAAMTSGSAIKIVHWIWQIESPTGLAGSLAITVVTVLAAGLAVSACCADSQQTPRCYYS